MVFYKIYYTLVTFSFIDGEITYDIFKVITNLPKLPLYQK